MAGYTRQSLAQILNGEIVSAPPLNAEFNQILAAFDESTGHKHDGTAAEGPPIDRIADLDQNNLIFVDTSANQINFYVESSAAAVGQISVQDGAIVPFTDNDIDLGSSSFEFKDLYIDGTANIDTLAASLIVVEAGTASAASITTTGDTDNGLYFNAANQMSYTSGGVAQVTFKDGSIVPVTDNDIDLGAVGAEFKDLYIDGTANIDSLVADTADINAGTIDNTIIGATTPAAATFTNLTVSTGSTIDFSGATVSNGGTFTTVNITGGSITGITDLAIADGGTGASTASAARTNLGLAIGTNVQAYDAGLQSISGLTTTADQMIYTTSSDTYATAGLTSAGRALLDDADASAQRTTLGLGTLATQNANSVAITGGTISGITNLSDIGNALPYTFSTTTTDSDPGSGVLRLNNATQNTATEIYIDDEEANAADVSAFIQLLSGGNNPSSVLGTITLRKEFNPDDFLQFKVTGVTNAAGYTKLTIDNTSFSAASPFSNSDSVFLDINLAGDKGDPGDVTGPASSTDNAIVRWDGTSGSLVQDSGVVIDDSGNVGVGTNAPSKRLHVVSTDANGGMALLENTSATQFSTAGLVLKNGATTGAKHALIGTLVRDGGGSNSVFTINRVNTGLSFDATLATYDLTSDFWTFLTAGSERLRIDSSGNVGIGTSSPGSNLHINSSGDTRLQITGDSAAFLRMIDNGGSTDGKRWDLINDSGNVIWRLVNDANNSTASIYNVVRSSNSVDRHEWYVGTNTEAMRIDSSGVVSVPGSINLTDAIGNGRSRLEWSSGLVLMNEDNTPLTLGTSNSERLRIDSSGNVGIGTTSPSALLDVDGTTRLGGAVSVEDNEVTRPKLKDYSETAVVANTGTTYTIDLENGNVFNLTLTGNCTYTFSNPPASGSAGSFTLIQNQDGTGSRTVTWPASVEWAGGSAPTITSTASSTDVFTFITTDGGTSWYGFTGGQDFS